jgi:restriction endonuclease S subunit
MTDHVILSDIAYVTRGEIPPKADRVTQGDLVFGLAELSESRQGERRYVDQDAGVRGKPRTQLDDLVVALAGDVGLAALVSSDYSGALLSRDCAAVRLQPGVVSLTPQWLYAWSQSAAFRSLIDRGMTGASVPRLSMRALERFVVPVPPIETQRTFAEILRAFDAAIGETRESLDLLEQLRAMELDVAIARAESLSAPTRATRS